MTPLYSSPSPPPPWGASQPHVPRHHCHHGLPSPSTASLYRHPFQRGRAARAAIHRRVVTAAVTIARGGCRVADAAGDCRGTESRTACWAGWRFPSTTVVATPSFPTLTGHRHPRQERMILVAISSPPGCCDTLAPLHLVAAVDSVKEDEPLLPSPSPLAVAALR
jgi:hypothetical protein